MSQAKNKSSVAAESQAAAVDSQVSMETMPEIKKTIVAAVYGGHIAIVKKVFESTPEGVDVRFIEVQDDNCLLEELAIAISDDSIPNEFIFVPAGTIPCGGIDIAALELPTVYEDKSGKKHFDSGLPLVIRKEDALDVIEEVSSLSGDVSEEFARRYIETLATRPVVVSFCFGNYVTPVRRANPCEHVIIEALARKKFLTSSPEGFDAMVPILYKCFS